MRIRPKRLLLAYLLVVALFFSFSTTSAARRSSQATDPIVIDARILAPPAEPLPFPIGETSPGGHSLSANRRYLIHDGKAWFPIMGEFHYSRYPADQWEQEILKMKAGGIQVISTYVFWIHHEEVEGVFDWTGQRDLRRFIQLCAKHGMYAWIRIGPWAHGEVRNGGLPDWLLQKTVTRENNPTYLNYVARFYGEIDKQVEGLLWKDGGPIIGIQLENEYSARGPGKGAEHIISLKQLAQNAGLDVPFYTVTGWDNAVIPREGILPVFGGYADGFWWRTLGELHPNPNYFFTKIRCQENVAENLSSLHPEIDALDSNYPFLTSEMGGGMEVAYHRRPLMSPDDTAAMELVKLGSGVTMYGYYMFHGGTNPDGKRTTLQESQATGYPNDLPVKSYDFQAPLGEFGQANPSFELLKTFHLFLGDFGAELATMHPYFPERVPANLDDTSTPRVSARLIGDRGFIFINNYQRNYPLAEHKNFQVHLQLPSGSIDIPRRPLTIPSGRYTFWPVNLNLGGTTLRYATAQLLCKLDNPSTYVFFASPGIPVEFSFADGSGAKIEASGARVVRANGFVYLDQIRPGTNIALRLGASNPESTNIIVLSAEQARHLWKLKFDGDERLILSRAQLYLDGDQLVLLSRNTSELRAAFLPPLQHRASEFVDAGEDGMFHAYSAHVLPVDLQAKIEKLGDAGPDPAFKMGKEVVLIPDESAFDSAARWRIQVPRVKSKSISEVLLKIKYEGDIARAYADGQLLDDNFYYGEPWVVSLDRVPAAQLTKSLELRILPLQRQVPIYLPRNVSLRLQMAQPPALEKVDLFPIYRTVMRTNP